ncbi:MAG: cyclic nucleotide-binding domain-containing protein [Pseudomonadota bacterium]
MQNFVGDIPTGLALIAGYAGCGIAVLAFLTKTIRTLRILAIISSTAFIVFALGSDLMPLLVLHAVLLAANLFRLVELALSYRRTRMTLDGPTDVTALIPLMDNKRCQAGEVLFLKGDRANQIYYISAGSVDIPEVGKTLEAGTLFGEIGLFTPGRTRTASAVCGEDCDLMVISDQDIEHHCLRNPTFGLYLTRLIAGRMVENQEWTATPIR